MCLPCFPWTWTKCEDPYDNLHRAPKQSVWVHDGQNWELQKVVSRLISLPFINFVNSIIVVLYPIKHPSMLRATWPRACVWTASDNQLEGKVTTKHAIEGYRNINKTKLNTLGVLFVLYCRLERCLCPVRMRDISSRSVSTI